MSSYGNNFVPLRHHIPKVNYHGKDSKSLHRHR